MKCFIEVERMLGRTAEGAILLKPNAKVSPIAGVLAQWSLAASIGPFIKTSQKSWSDTLIWTMLLVGPYVRVKRCPNVHSIHSAVYGER